MQHRVRRAVAIRHVHFEDLGCFAEVLAAAGYDTELIDAGMEDFED
jgi:GMP synthase (glutamine-hydrolysing)